ncbi:HAD-like domain-containing protein [Schizophyllum commune]
MIRALLIDLSGTLHIGSNPTPSAVKALQRLRDAGIPFRFCSNTSKESTDSLTERLRSMGFDVRSDGPGRELWTSIGAVTAALHKFGLNRPYYLLSDSARKEVEAGLAPRAAGGSDAHDAVVIGLDPPSFDYAHLNEAFRLLTGEARGVSGPGAAPRTRARLIATHKAKYIEGTAPPGLSLGPGPFVAALEYASGAQAHVVGKPSAEFFQMVIDDLGPTASGDGVIAVVGDDVDADLGGGAVQLGLWRVLVKTGKYRSGDEQKPGTVPPDEIADSFADFVDALLVQHTPKSA